MTFYVEIQTVDYDDYPLGAPSKIGPFESAEDAKDWLADTKCFETDYYGYWRQHNMRARHTVNVRKVESGLIHPDTYKEIWENR